VEYTRQPEEVAMTTRNLSPQSMFIKLAQEHRPTRAFQGKTRSDFLAWKKTTRPEVMRCLGDFPPPVPPKPELLAEWEHDGLRKQRWILDVQRHISATPQINPPPGRKKGERRPAILCWHGHGAYGKEPVMGNDSSAEMRRDIERMNYNYGHVMAKQGFVTFGIDWMGCGERNDNQKPNWWSNSGSRDWCNLYYLHATMLGSTSIAMNVAQGMAATSFVCRQPFVDPRRLGVMGLSGGGTMTLWSALADERIKAAEIICYSDLWLYFGFRDLNYCGMQVAPGLFKLVDLPDLQGLLAPRALLIDIGVHDTCFKVDTALACYRRVRRIYEAAGAGDRLELDLHPGEHGWSGRKAPAFFAEHLK